MRLKFTKSFFVSFVSVSLVFGLFGGGFWVYQKFEQSREKYQQSLFQLESFAKQSSKEATNKIKELQSLIDVRLEGQKKLNQDRQKEIQTLQAEIRAQQSLLIDKEPNLSDIISKWKKAVASLECEFGLYYKTGSGVLLGKINRQIAFVTNKHILTDKEVHGPSKCNIYFVDYEFNEKRGLKQYQSATTKYQSFLDNQEIKINPTYDLGWLIPHNSDTDPLLLRSLNYTQNLPLCDREPLLGEKIVILGYPAIGSQLTINATEGIISGFENNMDYFVTSAKVEQGNSGGAAILVKDDCLLGIPTFAQIGEIESLARILNINRVFNK